MILGLIGGVIATALVIAGYYFLAKSWLGIVKQIEESRNGLND
jgi:hypothetical protein